MEFKGTKGKWILRLNKKWPFNYDIETEKGEWVSFGICHYSTYDKSIDDCLKRNFEQNSKSLANAKIIAAAPEMFEMLKKVLDNSDVPNEIFDEAKKLLTKITQ